MPAPTGICSLCGKFGSLTFEHIPPEAAFNDRKVLLADIQRLMNSPDWNDFESPRGGKFQQRGAGAFTLCAKCNSNTGHWYGPQYVAWAYEGMRHLQAIAASGSSLRLPFMIQPLPVLKQIVCMFASACGPTLMEVNPDLRRWVLNPPLTGLPGNIGVYCYFISPNSRSTRQSGISGVLRIGHGASAFAEIAFPPFGYILSVDARPIDRELTDISFFGQFARRDFSDCYLRLPTREVNSYFPGDFRTISEIKADYFANRADGAASD